MTSQGFLGLYMFVQSGNMLRPNAIERTMGFFSSVQRSRTKNVIQPMCLGDSDQYVLPILFEIVCNKKTFLYVKCTCQNFKKKEQSETWNFGCPRRGHPIAPALEGGNDGEVPPMPPAPSPSQPSSMFLGQKKSFKHIWKVVKHIILGTYGNVSTLGTSPRKKQ